MIVGGALAAAGFVILALTWSAAADEVEVSLQLPYVLSGGFAGIAVVAVGLAVINVQATRRLNALRRHELARLVEEAVSVADRTQR